MDEYLLGTNEDNFFGKVSGIFNEVAYDRIMNGKINGTEAFIEICLSIPTARAFPLATMGLWYLRNEAISVEEAEENGIKYYQESLALDSENKHLYINDLNQKYFYEMGSFYFNRKKDSKAAAEFLENALVIGETGAFYQDVLELVNELSQNNRFIPTASSALENSEDDRGDHK